MSEGKTIIIDTEIHKKVKKYCGKNKIKLNEFINGLIEDFIEFEMRDRSVLPLILKLDGEVLVKL